jgi:hypothetical protein
VSLEALVDSITFASNDGRERFTVDVVVEDVARLRVRNVGNGQELRLTVQQARVLAGALQRVLDGR